MSSRDALEPAAIAASEQPWERPRFSLRFEAGRGIATLARPLTFSGGELTRLTADLGHLRLPLDLRSGANRFRHRRARALELEARVDLDELARLLSRDDVTIRVRSATPETLSLALRDAFRTIAFDLWPAWEGRDLVLALRNVRTALEGPQSAIADVLTFIRGFGVRLDAELGVLRIADPLLHVLTEALVPHGWRVPDVASAPRGAGFFEGRHLVLRAGRAVPMLTATRNVLEEARVLAPLVKDIALDEGNATRIATDLAFRNEPLRTAIEAIAADIMLATGRPAILARGTEAALRLRAALRTSDHDAAAQSARELGASEACDDVAIEGLRAASALLREPDPVVAADLSARALARRPRDGALAMEWLERASCVPDSDALVHALRSLRGSFVGSARGAVLRAAAALLDRVGEQAESLRAWEEASQLTPDDAAVCEGLAHALARLGRDDEALSAWDRATQLHSNHDHAARALIFAASLAKNTNHRMGAAARLESATARASSDEVRATAWAALARVRREMGASLAAIEAETALLDLSERVRSRVVEDALFEAARHATAEGAEMRARQALEALRRMGAPEAELRALERDLDARELVALDHDAPEDSNADPNERALRARAIAERLRASGRLGDAAVALARAGAIMGDAATLRAALELAEKAEAWAAALLVIERAIEIVGDGPARGALESRRAAIHARLNEGVPSRSG